MPKTRTKLKVLNDIPQQCHTCYYWTTPYKGKTCKVDHATKAHDTCSQWAAATTTRVLARDIEQILELDAGVSTPVMLKCGDRALVVQVLNGDFVVQHWKLDAAGKPMYGKYADDAEAQPLFTGMVAVIGHKHLQYHSTSEVNSDSSRGEPVVVAFMEKPDEPK